MTDDQIFVATIFGLFWLLPLLVAIFTGRCVTLRQAILTAVVLLVLLLLGAAWAYLGNRDRGYGPGFALNVYLIFVAGPVLGSGVIGLSLGQFWRRKARGSTDR